VTEYRPSDEAILAASKVIENSLRFHGHFKGLPTYEEMLVSDPIGASEWGGVIERALMAAHEAELDKTSSS
jgi:hypothetical protein